MKDHVERSAEWVYEGVWAVLSRWFHVPAAPPQLPADPSDELQTFHPAVGFLRYLKFWFWLLLVVIDGLILAGWIAIAVGVPWLGMLLAGPALLLAVVPDILAYIAIHLRYDTTWYVLGNRSMRLRRGIWVIRETTITYENVQDIKVTQGPLQRFFGISNLLVETAGGGGHDAEGGSLNTHCGLIEGVSNAHEIRDLILARVRESTSAGLGDESTNSNIRSPRFSPQHLSILAEIRDGLQSLRGRA